MSQTLKRQKWNGDEKDKSWTSSQCNFLQPAVTSSLFNPNTLSLCSSFNVNNLLYTQFTKLCNCSTYWCEGGTSFQELSQQSNLKTSHRYFLYSYIHVAHMSEVFLTKINITNMDEFHIWLSMSNKEVHHST